MAFLLVFIPVFAFADDVSNASSVSDVSDVSSQAVVSDTSEPETEPVITSGNAIVVMSVETGQILLNTANGREVDPTCATKLMTAMLAFDMANGLDNQVTVDAEALKNIGKKG